MGETKYIFVTGGVASSLGKGIISSSIGKLLQARGYNVTIQKFDPYINIDPRYHQSIFDRYFRVPGTKVQGSGLGLSISKDFVDLCQHYCVEWL